MSATNKFQDLIQITTFNTNDQNLLQNMAVDITNIVSPMLIDVKNVAKTKPADVTEVILAKVKTLETLASQLYTEAVNATENGTTVQAVYDSTYNELYDKTVALAAEVNN